MIYTKEDIRMTNKPSLAIKEMQVKTMMRYHYIPIRMAKINKTDNNTKF